MIPTEGIKTFGTAALVPLCVLAFFVYRQLAFERDGVRVSGVIVGFTEDERVDRDNGRTTWKRGGVPIVTFMNAHGVETTELIENRGFELFTREGPHELAVAQDDPTRVRLVRMYATKVNVALAVITAVFLALAVLKTRADMRRPTRR